jgi:pimeloyl-ACP methyl ester carboxylesterase
LVIRELSPAATADAENVGHGQRWLRAGSSGYSSARRNTKRLPRGSYVEIRDCGHVMPWEKPEALLEALCPFLAGAAMDSSQRA